MSQHDFTIENASGAAVRADLNNALQALASLSGGASAPGTTFAGQLWADTTNSLLKMRDTTNASWITVGTLDVLHLGLGLIPKGYLYGLTLSNNVADATNDVDIAAGDAASDDTTDADRVRMVLAAGITKRLDAAWAVGTGNGGLDTGSIANATYHLWLIERPDTGVVDVLFSTSATSPNMPANYTKKRRIGAILRESAAIVPFIQDGDLFERKAGAADVSAANPGTSAVTRTLSVPTGIVIDALVCSAVAQGSNLQVFGSLTALDITDAAASQVNSQMIADASATYAAGRYDAWQGRIRTNTSAQIRSRLNASDAQTTLFITTRGWYDRRA